MSDHLETRLKELIVDTLGLTDISPNDISDDQPLMGEELGLDSIDALELVVRIEKEFRIKLENSEDAREALRSVSSMAGQIRKRRGASA